MEKQNEQKETEQLCMNKNESELETKEVPQIKENHSSSKQLNISNKDDKDELNIESIQEETEKDDDDNLSSNNILGELSIKAEKVIKPGLVLVKTDQEAVVLHTKEPIENDSEPKELLQKLKSSDNPDMIYINMGDIEDQYLNGNLLGDNEPIDHDEKTMNKLMTDVALRHPCKIKDGRPVKYPLCINTGWFCGCDTCKKSKMTELGIGMIVYFKIIKALIISFFIITLLNIPIIATYIKNKKDKKINGYMDALYKTTIGNIASTLYMCKPYEESSSLTLSMRCSNDMVIAQAVSFGVSANSDDEKNNVLNCFEYMAKSEIILSNSQCNYINQINELMKANNCSNQQSCNFIFDLSSNECTKPVSTGQFYFTYLCYEDKIETIFTNSKMRRSTFGYIVVGVDILTILIVIITMSLINIFKEENNDEFIKKRTFIRDFTLRLKDISIPKSEIRKEFNLLINHLISIAKFDDDNLDIFSFEPISLKHHPQYEDYDKVISSKFQAKDFFVYDMVYPILTSAKLGAINHYNELQEEIADLKKEMNILHDTVTNNDNNMISEKETPNEKDTENAPITVYKSSDTVLPVNNTTNANRNNETEKERIKRENKLTELQKEIDEKTKEMEETKIHIKENSDIKEVNEIYITFRNYNIARYFAELYRKSKCQRCNIICCCQGEKIQHLYYKDQWLNLSFAKDEPSNIKWENITYSPCEKCLRSTFSVILAIIIIIITLIIILICKAFERDLSDDFNSNIDCDKIQATEQDVINEYNSPIPLTDKEKYHTYCFCYNKMSENIGDVSNVAISGLPNQKPCKKFFNSYIKYTSISIALVLAIPIINSIVVIVLKQLTKFEKNTTLSSDMSANMWKMFVVQFINTFILIIIVNTKISALQVKFPNFPFFAGNYDDIDPSWYNNVGATLLFSMILNVFTPHLTSLGFMWLTFIFRCCDSGCSHDGRITKKKTRKEYIKLYSGPTFDIDARYASILTYMFIVFIIGSGMPLLYCCFFVYILLTQIIDKIMILRYYKNPPRYDLTITNTFSNVLSLALFLHFFFAVWIYGHPSFLIDNLKENIEYDFLDKIINRLCIYHNFIIEGIFGILLLIWIIRFMFVNGICACCKKKKEDNVIDKNQISNPEIGLAVPLRELYQNYQVKQIEYFQSLKCEDDADIEMYRNNLHNSIRYCKEFILYKLMKDCGKNGEDYKIGFDEKLNEEQELLDVKCKKIIRGDTSYNLVFIPEFEAVAYFEYLKNM